MDRIQLLDFGDLIAAFVAKLAELERKRIKARIVAGLNKARADGKSLGRPRVIVDRSRVCEMRDAGASIRDIVTELKLSHGTVQRIVQSRGRRLTSSIISV